MRDYSDPDKRQEGLFCCIFDLVDCIGEIFFFFFDFPLSFLGNEVKLRIFT